MRSSSLNTHSVSTPPASTSVVTEGTSSNKTVLVLGGAGVLAAALVGYGMLTPDPASIPVASCGLIVDVTHSVDTDHIDAELVASVVEACAVHDGGGTLTAVAVGSGPSKVASIGTFDLTGGDSSNPTTREVRRHRAAEAATQELADTIAGMPHAAGPSDLVGALAVLANQLPTSTTSTTITLLTDGLQATSSLTVEDLVGESDVAELVTAALELETIELQGVVVNLVGVNSGQFRGEQLGRAFEVRLQAFWTSVVEAAGGCVATYAPELVAELSDSCAVAS